MAIYPVIGFSAWMWRAGWKCFAGYWLAQKNVAKVPARRLAKVKRGKAKGQLLPDAGAPLYFDSLLSPFHLGFVQK